MKLSMMKGPLWGVGLSLAVLTAACGGGMADGGAQTASSAGGTVSVSVKLGLPKVGNPKYDKFFNDVVELSQLVADARAALETAPATLNKAMSVAGATDFDTALKNIAGKLKDKVTVNIGVGPAGADVNVVAASGVTLSAEEQGMMDAYKKVLVDIVAIPVKLEPVVPKSVDIAKQAAVLVAGAKSDFSGMQLVTTLPSVIAGMNKVTAAMNEIKTDVPVIIEKSKTMTVAIKGAV